jgi:transcriptional regulator with XRE-family HTH domain
LQDEGLTQKQAASRLGVSQGAVSQLLSGMTGVPSLALAAALERETARWSKGPIKVDEWARQSGKAA